MAKQTDVRKRQKPRSDLMTTAKATQRRLLYACGEMFDMALSATSTDTMWLVREGSTIQDNQCMLLHQLGESTVEISLEISDEFTRRRARMLSMMLSTVYNEPPDDLDWDNPEPIGFSFQCNPLHASTFVEILLVQEGNYVQ